MAAGHLLPGRRHTRQTPGRCKRPWSGCEHIIKLGTGALFSPACCWGAQSTSCSCLRARVRPRCRPVCTVVCMYVCTVRTLVVYLSALPSSLCARQPACGPCRTNSAGEVRSRSVSACPSRCQCAAVCHRSARLPSHPRCCTSTGRLSLALQLSIVCMAESSRRLATTARRGGVRASAARVVASAANNVQAGMLDECWPSAARAGREILPRPCAGIVTLGSML